MPFAPPPRLVAVFDPQGRAEPLDRVFAALDAAAAAPGLARVAGAPAHPALARRLRLAVHGEAPIRPRPGGGIATGRVRLYDGPPGETLAGEIDRLAAALEAGRFAGPAAVAPVEGDFALLHARIVSGAPRLTLLRDAFGTVPIWTLRSPEGVTAVSTEPLALLALPFAPTEPDADRLAAFGDTLRLPAAGSLWPGLDAVRPGAALEIGPDGAETRIWWRPGPDPALAGLDEAELMDAIEARARAALRGAACRLGPDPAAMLSGGLDSTLIATLLAEIEPGRRRAAYVSVSASGPGAEERAPQAAVFAALPDLVRHDVDSEGLDPLDGGESFWRGQALPCFDLVEFKTLALMRRMRADGRDGTLSGVGGDLVVSLQARSLLAEALAGADPALLAAAWRMRRAQGGRPRGILFREVTRRLPGFGWLARFDRWENDDARRLHPARSRARAPAFRAAGQGSWNMAPRRLAEEERQMLHPALSWVAPDRLLPDGAGGHVAAPAARPLMDTRLLAAVMAAPPRLRIHEGLDRGVMRRLLARLGAPQAVRLRRDKSLFEPDLPRLHRDAALAQGPRLRAAAAAHPMFREIVDTPLMERRLAALAARAPGPRSAPEAFALLRAAQLAAFLDRLAARR
ncbi:MAG: asparagine synthase-related protein [Paracoccaceae bacterium]